MNDSMNRWRQTALPARFLFVDGVAVFSFILFFIHMSLWTFCVILIVMFILFLAERRGLTPVLFYQYILSRVGQALGGGGRSIPCFRTKKVISHEIR
jgi:hypothetical protein